MHDGVHWHDTNLPPPSPPPGGGGQKQYRVILYRSSVELADHQNDRNINYSNNASGAIVLVEV